MKYIRLYEGNDKLKIGDYVLCEEDEYWFYNLKKDSDSQVDIINRFVTTTIGRYISETTHNSFSKFSYLIKYNSDDIPPDLIESFTHIDNNGDSFEDCRVMSRIEIKYFSSNRDDLEMLLTVNKFNI